MAGHSWLHIRLETYLIDRIWNWTGTILFVELTFIVLSFSCCPLCAVYACVRRDLRHSLTCTLFLYFNGLVCYFLNS